LFPSRRTFLRQLSAFTALSRALPAFTQQSMQNGMRAAPQGIAARKPVPMLHSLELPPFVDALPLPERLRPAPPKHKGQPHTLRVAMREVQAKYHRDVPASRFWSYGDGALASMIEVRARQPVQIEWVNNLPPKHFLPVDYTLHGCGHDVPEVRAIVHVHGAKVLPKDDGYPTDWFVPGSSRTCLYPLDQDATALWYHDHAMGLNRLNIYAGLFGMFVIRDEVEDALHLPAGKYEVPLMLYDRDFTADGQLFYPDSGIPGHPWVPEFIADAILINGKLRPYFEVEPRLYRFRVLNSANSRFFALSLSQGRKFHQIGSDQGLLAAPVPLTSLNLAPAERADLLIDFSGLARQKLHLLNGALEVLEFRVSGSDETRGNRSSLPAALRPVPGTPESDAVMTRTITLNEYRDRVQNPMVMLLNRMHWHDPVTETPRLNTTEIWEFVNLTEDVHPMHLHLVRFQLLDRRVFDVFRYQANRQVKFLGGAIGPEPQEAGWKDTIQCPPGMITRIITRFEGYPGKYLYHCHILEHESNDMMRPFEVLA
jgi:spore coat protein A